MLSPPHMRDQGEQTDPHASGMLRPQRPLFSKNLNLATAPPSPPFLDNVHSSNHYVSPRLKECPQGGVQNVHHPYFHQQDLRPRQSL